MSWLHVLSNVMMVFLCVYFINAFGVSEIKGFKHQLLLTSISIVSFVLIEYAYSLSYDIIPLLIYPLAFVFSYIISFGKITWAQLYITVIMELTVSLLSSCCTLLIMQMTIYPYIVFNTFSLFGVRSVLLIISVILIKNKSVNRVYSLAKVIPKYTFLLILLSFVCITIVSSCNSLPVESHIKRNIMTLFIMLLIISLIIMIFSLLINVASKNYYTALNSLLEKQVATQISHYEKLEKLNSDMRTFRHDYINHLSSINALIGEGCYTDAQKYIDKLTESTRRNEAIYLTGNRLADAILTDKSDNCKDFADIEFDGCITDKIENSDICIILANALDNAVEACKKCPERGKISIAAQIRQGYWTMAMRNPTVSADSEGIMKTSKEDEKNHGFGLLSIEQAVKKYDGTMAVSIKDGAFEMAVVLKIPVEN